MKLGLFCLLLLSITNINYAQLLQKDGIKVSYEHHWGSLHCPATPEFRFPYYITIENNSSKKCIIHPAIIKNQLLDRTSVCQAVHRKYNGIKALTCLCSVSFAVLTHMLGKIAVADDFENLERNAALYQLFGCLTVASFSGGIFSFFVDSTVETKIDTELITFPLILKPGKRVTKLVCIPNNGETLEINMDAIEFVQ